MSQPSRIRQHRKNFLSALTVSVLLACAGGAWADVPTVVVDAQIAGPAGFNGPQSIAMAPNDIYYVANTGANTILAFVNGNQTTVSTGAYKLVNAEAVAVDAAGDLFIGDQPVSGTGRVLEAMATNGVLNGVVALVVSGGGLQDVTALTVDTNYGSSTFGTLYIGDDVSNAIFTVGPGGTTLTKLDLTGLPPNIFPSALAKDSSGNLFVADLLSTVYEIPAGTTGASPYTITGFTVFSPTGLAFDSKGDLFILTLTSTGPTPSQPVPENLIEVPQENASSAYIVPFSGPENASGIAIDSYGTIYILDFILQDVTELVYGAPVSLGSETVNQYGTTPVIFNYALNSAFREGGVAVTSKGDASAEATNSSNGCQAPPPDYTFTDGSNGGPISSSDPYVCQAGWVASPLYPGVRRGAIQYYGEGGYVLASAPFFETGLDGASVVYPLTPSTAATNINGPLALAVSGLDKSLYVVNDGAPPSIIHINGPDGTKQTTVSTAPVTLSAPMGLALNYEGDLYIADFGPQSGQGQIVIVPALKGETPVGINFGGLLQHPISVAFDTFGNLLIGDSGPGGLNSDPGNPGFIVEVPAGGGTPFKLNTGAVSIYFPQALAADPYTRQIYVGDGGYPSGSGIARGSGKVVSIPPAGGSASIVTPGGEGGSSGPNPVGIVFDPAEDYYILDGNTATITVVPPAGRTPYPLPFSNALLSSPSALATTAGGQDFVIANYGSTGVNASNNLIYLDGTASALSFGDVPITQQSSTMTAILNNIGTTGLTLGSPYYTANDPHAQFDILSTTTCSDGVDLAPASQCTIEVQFQPTRLRAQRKKLTFQTDGYLPSDSVLTLTGTGTLLIP